MKKCVKVKYADEKTALAAIETIKKKSTRAKRPTKAYFCNGCQVWHLTSQKTREELRDENFSLTQEIESLKKQLADAHKQIESLTRDQTKEEKSLARIKRKNDDLFIQATNRAEKASEQVKRLRSTVSDLITKLNAKTNQNDSQK